MNTIEQLTDVLAVKVMDWSLAPDRYMLGKRKWIPRWRFQPLENLSDAFQLLDAVTADYSLVSTEGAFTAEVRVGGSVGTASSKTKALAITLAVAKALGLYQQTRAESLIGRANRGDGGARRP